MAALVVCYDAIQEIPCHGLCLLLSKNVRIIRLVHLLSSAKPVPKLIGVNYEYPAFPHSGPQLIKFQEIRKKFN